MRWLQRPFADGPSERACGLPVLPPLRLLFKSTLLPVACLVLSSLPLPSGPDLRACMYAAWRMRQTPPCPGAHQPRLGCGLLPALSICYSASKTPSVCFVQLKSSWSLRTKTRDQFTFANHVFSVTKGLIWLLGTGPSFCFLITLHPAPGLIFEHREQPFHRLCSQTLHTLRRQPLGSNLLFANFLLRYNFKFQE